MESWRFHPSEASGLPGLLPREDGSAQHPGNPSSVCVSTPGSSATRPPPVISTPSTALWSWNEGQLPRPGPPLRSARAQSHFCPEGTCPQAPRGQKYSVALIQLSLLYDLNKYLLIINSDQGQP